MRKEGGGRKVELNISTGQIKRVEQFTTSTTLINSKRQKDSDEEMEKSRSLVPEKKTKKKKSRIEPPGKEEKWRPTFSSPKPITRGQSRG